MYHAVSFYEAKQAFQDTVGNELGNDAVPDGVDDSNSVLYSEGFFTFIFFHFCNGISCFCKVSESGPNENNYRRLQNPLSSPVVRNSRQLEISGTDAFEDEELGSESMFCDSQ